MHVGLAALGQVVVKGVLLPHLPDIQRRIFAALDGSSIGSFGGELCYEGHKYMHTYILQWFYNLK